MKNIKWDVVESMAISFVRTIIIFATIMVALRIMGKRQLGELEPSELVVTVLISDIAATPMQDPGTPLFYGLVPVLALLCFEVLISGTILKNIKLRGIICGKPSILINNGKIMQNEMKKNRFTLDELGVELRRQNITDIETVKHAILETDGSLSILLYPEETPVTAKQLNIKPDPVGYPVIVVNNGRTLSDNLKLIGRDKNWLEKQLKQRNVSDIKQVFLMTVDPCGKIYFARKDAQ